jgi:oligopeptide/dipeptide ABC transporter ATP-binding protein
VTTKSPDPILPLRLSFVEIVPHTTSTKAKVREPIGTGPYAVADWQTGISITLTRNDRYWGDALAYPRVRYVWRSGNVVETGPVREVFDHPRHPYTKGLLDSVPEHAQKGVPLPAVAGSPPELAAIPVGCVFQARCPFAADWCVEERPRLEPAADGRAAACHFSEELTHA